MTSVGFEPTPGVLRTRESLGRKAGKFSVKQSSTAALLPDDDSADAVPTTSRSVDEAVASELQRSLVVVEIVRLLAEAASDAAKRAVGATGLLPGLIFESLSIKPVAGAERDVFLPHMESVLSAGGPVCLHRRLRTLLHDARRDKADAVPAAIIDEMDAEAWSRAKALGVAIGRTIDSMSRPSASTPEIAAVTLQQIQGGVFVLSGRTRHFVSAAHLTKLRELYRGPEGEFERWTFCLLQRYYNLGGCQAADVEGGWHGAVPFRVMRAMQAHLGVRGECFASPFNCTFRRYCSAFLDTDRSFGSMGSFFERQTLDGMYEANPPFDHAVALNMAHHIRTLLTRTQVASGVVVVLPYSDKGKVLDSLTPAVDVMRQSGFLRAEETIAASQCDYIDGAQQCTTTATAFVARLDTRLFVLQNEAGAARWPADAGLRAVLSEWMDGQPDAQAEKRDREMP